VAILGLSLASCASLSRNARQSQDRVPQVADPLEGAGNLALTAFRATAVASVRQPITTVGSGVALFWHRSREVVVGNVPVSREPTVPPADSPGSEGFEAMLDQEGLPTPEPGRLRCLVDGEEFFGEFDRLLERSRESVDVQVFIFDNDDIACRYARRLGEVSETRAVRVLFDDLGTSWAAVAAPETPGPDGFVPPGDMKRHLEKDSRVGVRRTLNPWLMADHTKLLLFDGEVALLGGMNIGREYFSEWHDLMVRVEGPVVASLQREFDVAWSRAGPWGDFARVPERSGPVHGRGLRVLRTDAAAGRVDIFKATIAAIRASRRRVWIENPYFSSDEVLRAAVAAAGRGVDVRVVLPSRNDSTIMDAGNLATARELIRAGAKVYRYPGMTHLKAMICDDWATLGSANLDTLSMRINRELNVAFRAPEEVGELERRVFLEDFRRSRVMKLEETESAVARLAESIADQL